MYIGNNRTDVTVCVRIDPETRYPGQKRSYYDIGGDRAWTGEELAELIVESANVVKECNPDLSGWCSDITFEIFEEQLEIIAGIIARSIYAMDYGPVQYTDSDTWYEDVDVNIGFEYNYNGMKMEIIITVPMEGCEEVVYNVTAEGTVYHGFTINLHSAEHYHWVWKCGRMGYGRIEKDVQKIELYNGSIHKDKRYESISMEQKGKKLNLDPKHICKSTREYMQVYTTLVHVGAKPIMPFVVRDRQMFVFGDNGSKSLNKEILNRRK